MVTPLYYGIDVSKDTLQIAYQCPQTNLWKDHSLVNQIEANDAFLKELDQSAILFVYECTGTYSHRLTY